MYWEAADLFTAAATQARSAVSSAPRDDAAAARRGADRQRGDAAAGQPASAPPAAAPVPPSPPAADRPAPPNIAGAATGGNDTAPPGTGAKRRQPDPVNASELRSGLHEPGCRGGEAEFSHCRCGGPEPGVRADARAAHRS